MKTQSTRRPRFHRPSLSSWTLLATLVALIAVIGIPLFSLSSASSPDKRLGVGIASTPSAAGVSNRMLSKRESVRISDSLFTSDFAPSGSFSLMLPQSPAETIETFASDCTTPKTDFDLGETVCAKVSGAPLPVDGRAQRRIGWVSPYGSLAQGADITMDPQNGIYLIPTSQTQTFTDDGGGTVVVDNRGTWSVNTFATADGSRRISAFFTVHDPATPYVDLSVGQSVSEANSTVAAGSSSAFNIIVSNQGPDTAANVVLTDTVPNDTTFVAIAQTSGPTFTCTTPVLGGTGTITCSIASLARGDTATFDLAYNVNAGTPNGTLITNTATISSDTAELVPNDNSSTRSSRVGSGGGGGGTGTCSVACPDDIITPANTVDQDNNPGAVVHFSPPSGNDECGAVTTDHCNDCFFPVGTTTVTGTATTGESCSFTVTVTPPPSGNAPTISCPANQVATADSTCQATVDPGQPTTTGENVTVTGTRSDERPLTDPYPSGTTTITWIATNSSGSALCQQTITVNDTTPPTIEAPPGSTASADENCQAAVPDFTASATASDNCGTAEVSQDPIQGTMVGPGQYTITLTATDGSGSTATATTTFTVNDATAPTITCPANITQANDAGACSATIDPGMATATDNCDSSTTVNGTRSDGQPLNAPYPVGTTTITWTATDAANNSSSCTQTVTINDSENPTVTAPADSSASADASCQAVVPDYAAGSTAADNCGNPTVTQSPAAGSMVGLGSHTVTVTATDSAGNASSDTVVFTVNDTTAPTVTAPADSSASADASCQATVPNFAAGSTVSDNCDTNLTVTQSPAAGTMVGAGPHTVTVTATDDAGNSSSDTVVFTVNDTTAPTISCPANITTNSEPGTCAAHVNPGAATASDNCGTATVTGARSDGRPLGDTYPVGTTTITWTATDGSGNQSTCSQTVTVSDNEAPTIEFNNLTIFLNNWTIVFSTNTVTINGTTYPFNGVSCTHNGYTFTFNGQNVTITHQGQSASYTFEGKSLVLWTPTHQYQLVKVADLIASASDLCDSTVNRGSVGISQVTSDEPENAPGNGDGNTANDIVIAPDCKSVQLRAERANGGNGRVYTITFTVRDASGNTTTATSKVRVRRYPFQAAVDSGPQYTVNSSCP